MGTITYLPIVVHLIIQAILLVTAFQIRDAITTTIHKLVPSASIGSLAFTWLLTLSLLVLTTSLILFLGKYHLVDPSKFTSISEAQKAPKNTHLHTEKKKRYGDNNTPGE